MLLRAPSLLTEFVLLSYPEGDLAGAPAAGPEAVLLFGLVVATDPEGDLQREPDLVPRLPGRFVFLPLADAEGDLNRRVELLFLAGGLRRQVAAQERAPQLGGKGFALPGPRGRAHQ